MGFSTPKFWYQKRGLYAYLLLPIAWIYQLVHRLNQSKNIQPFKSQIPVICIGNAVAGGGGKTPTVIALINLIKAHNIAARPYIITRGYGGSMKNTHIVDLSKDTPEAIGDEAILLANHAPVIVGEDRKKSMEMAQELGADVIIMDDGFFNQSINKDIKIIVIDRNMDFGNGLTIPAGPLREPLKNILPKTNAIITIGPKFHSDLPVFESDIHIISNHPNKDRYIAFCGIGFPEKFKATLQKSGYDLFGWHEFSDHHAYTKSDIRNLLDEAKEKKCRLITTAKDFVKIPAEYKEMIDILKIELHFTNDDEIAAYLKETLKQSLVTK